MRRSKFLKLKVREASFITRALLSANHPVLAHIIPMRRCNLACGYCNEYDHNSTPVPLDVMKRRLDKLADLGTSIVTDQATDVQGKYNRTTQIGETNVDNSQRGVRYKR